MSPQWPHCVRPGGMFGPYYGTLWERAGDEGTGKNTNTTDIDEQTQVQLLCKAWWTFANLYINEETTDEDRAEFQRMCRSEEHTSELQSRQYLVCRLLLEKKKKHNIQLD